jgi:hypothetical protein
MQKKSFLAYAIAIAGIVVLSGVGVTPALSQAAQKAMNTTANQLHPGTSSFAYAPQQVNAGPRYGQCWIATDSTRPYGYQGSCASPRTSDPALDPTYNPEW